MLRKHTWCVCKFSAVPRNGLFRLIGGLRQWIVCLVRGLDKVSGFLFCLVLGVFSGGFFPGKV